MEPEQGTISERSDGADRRALLEAARAGDARAFEALFTPDLDLAWRMALRVTGEPALADDALQEGLLSAFQHLHRVQPQNLRGWIVRIVQNAARDLQRYERRRPSLQITTDKAESEGESGARNVAPELRAGGESDPAAAAERRELAHKLATALEKIPEERRIAILLFDVDGYDYASIAEICGISVGTVKSRISRGRRDLRPLLAAEWERAGNRTTAHDVEEGR
jgi:RNA polymerase sigma-70 factor (ECF subfamily)